MSCEPNHDASKLNEGEETASELAEAGSDTTKLLKLLHEALHKMTFLVQEPVTFPGMLFIGLRRDAVSSIC